MRIAVLTYNFNNNYGGMLQAYATLSYLRKLGHQPELLFVQTIDLSFKHRFKYLLIKNVLSYFTDRWPNIKYKDKIEKNTNYFINNYINPKTKYLYKKEHFESIEKNNYAAYIVGSDQVWRAKVYRYIDYAFFGFVKSNKPIFLSYAASFGIDSWEFTEEETIRYKQEIKRFKGISVREDSGIKLCKENLNVDAVHVLDPTMLLDIQDYLELILNENETVHDGELLTYILDTNEEKNSIIKMISEELNIKPFTVTINNNEVKIIEDLVYPTVTSWLKGFHDAKYIITDSFHGCVFSIIFNKPFLVYGNKERGMARFNSLLKMFNLEDRFLLNNDDYSKGKLNQKIDWDIVNKKLKEYRNISKNFLINTLKENNE